MFNCFREAKDRMSKFWFIWPLSESFGWNCARATRLTAVWLLPRCNFTSGQPKFFRALFSAPARRRFKSLFNFFTLLQQTLKNTFCLHFYWLMFFFTVTTCVWCLYFLYLSVLLAGKCHPRTYGRRLHVTLSCWWVNFAEATAHDFQCQVRNLNLKDVEIQTKISITL